MAKPQIFNCNRPNPSEGTGEGEEETGGAEEGMGKCGEGGEGKEMAANEPPPRRATRRKREGHQAREGEDVTEQVPKGEEE